jgi:hypothetical protein
MAGAATTDGEPVTWSTTRPVRVGTAEIEVEVEVEVES